MRQTNYRIEDVTGYWEGGNTNEDKVQRLSVPGVWIGDLELDLNFFDSKRFFFPCPSTSTTRSGGYFLSFFCFVLLTAAMTILDRSLIQNYSQTVSDLRGGGAEREKKGSRIPVHRAPPIGPPARRMI